MASNIFFLSALIGSSIQLVHPAQILGIHPLVFPSHYGVMSPIMLALAEKGHNVTVLTAIKQAKHPPNYHQIVVDPVDFWKLTGNEGSPNYFLMKKKNFVSDQHLLWKTMQSVTDEVLKSLSLQEFIVNDTSHFDVIICEEFFIQSFYMFVHKYKAPLVLITPFGAAHYISNYMGNPLELATVPHEFLAYFGQMDIWQETRGVLCTLWDLIIGPMYKNKHDEIAARHFKTLLQPLPSIKDLERNASLVLLNTHFSIDSVRPYLPNIIEVGGMHIMKPQKLPPDLQKVMDNAKDGVIYFSLGSNLKSRDLPPEKLEAFLKAFSKLNKTILWKWEDESFENQPSNVYIKKWMPQNDILAHSNVKLFITHGGLLSAQEALHNGIPIIGMPIFGDQYRNVAKARYMGYGEGIEFNTIDENTVSSVLDKVLNDPSYKTKAKEYGLRFKDKPFTALETAIYWIEYVIRHKGAMHMKPISVWMPWYQYYLLDVTALLLFGVIIATLTIYCALKTLLRLYQGGDKILNVSKKTQ